MFGLNRTAASGKSTPKTGIARKLLLAVGAFGLAATLIGSTPAMAHEVVTHEIVTVVPGIEIGYHHHHRVWVPAHYELQTVFIHGCPVTQQVFVPGHFEYR